MNTEKRKSERSTWKQIEEADRRGRSLHHNFNMFTEETLSILEPYPDHYQTRATQIRTGVKTNINENLRQHEDHPLSLRNNFVFSLSISSINCHHCDPYRNEEKVQEISK